MATNLAIANIKAANNTLFLNANNVEVSNNFLVNGDASFQNVNITGDSLKGFNYLAASYSINQRITTFHVTVAPKDPTHRYADTEGFGYVINGVQAPFLTLIPGHTYIFDQSDICNNDYPLIISTIFSNDVSAGLYTPPDITYRLNDLPQGFDIVKSPTNVWLNRFNDAANTSRTITIKIDETMPNILYYMCKNNLYMGNSFQTNGIADASGIQTVTGTGTGTTGGDYFLRMYLLDHIEMTSSPPSDYIIRTVHGWTPDYGVFNFSRDMGAYNSSASAVWTAPADGIYLTTAIVIVTAVPTTQTLNEEANIILYHKPVGGDWNQGYWSAPNGPNQGSALPVMTEQLKLSAGDCLRIAIYNRDDACKVTKGVAGSDPRVATSWTITRLGTDSPGLIQTGTSGYHLGMYLPLDADLSKNLFKTVNTWESEYGQLNYENDFSEEHGIWTSPVDGILFANAMIHAKLHNTDGPQDNTRVTIKVRRKANVPTNNQYGGTDDTWDIHGNENILLPGQATFDGDNRINFFYSVSVSTSLLLYKGDQMKVDMYFFDHYPGGDTNSDTRTLIGKYTSSTARDNGSTDPDDLNDGHYCRWTIARIGTEEPIVVSNFESDVTVTPPLVTGDGPTMATQGGIMFYAPSENSGMGFKIVNDIGIGIATLQESNRGGVLHVHGPTGVDSDKKVSVDGRNGYISVSDSINIADRVKILFNSTNSDTTPNQIYDDMIFKFFTTPNGEAAEGHFNGNQPEALFIRVYNTTINYTTLSTKGVNWLIHSDNLAGDGVGAVQLICRKLELKDQDGFGAVLQGFDNGNSGGCDEFNITMEGVEVLRITRFPTREGTSNNSPGYTQITMAGHFDAYTSTLASDDRLKHNEEALTGRSLAVVRQLQPQVYDKAISLNDPSNTIREAGFIAQHVEQIPELVNAGAVHVGTDEELFSLNYNSIFTYAVAATKELDAIVQNQENEITSLKTEINILKTKNELLESKLNELLIEAGKTPI
jgi:hypothetical protein